MENVKLSNSESHTDEPRKPASSRNLLKRLVGYFSFRKSKNINPTGFSQVTEISLAFARQGLSANDLLEKVNRRLDQLSQLDKHTRQKLELSQSPSIQFAQKGLSLSEYLY